ncbi:MAG: hypothetical protein NWE98_00505 [Candidatus Bathyarchaeota archaeon]|nr:hypothetical protein [Candidatus Bathyarchaeota archaeon]
MKRRTAATAFSWKSNKCLSFFHFKDAVWTKFNAAWLASFGATVTFVSEDCGEPWTIRASHGQQPLIA